MRLRTFPLFALLLIAVSAAIWLGIGTFTTDWIPFWRGAEFSDLLITHIPNALYIRRSIGEWGQLPLWNTMILSGMPFAADPLAGLWYPPNWLAVLLPVGLGYNLLFWLHLIWAGVGVWRLSRAEGISLAGSLFAGLAFSGSSKLFAHIGLGHVGLVAAVSWMPWALIFAHESITRQKESSHRDFRYPALGGVVIGLIFVIDPRWALPTLVLTLAYMTYLSFRDSEVRFEIPRLVKIIGVTALFIVITSAILAIPMFELTIRSTRWGLTAGESTSLSLPTWSLLGFLTPLLTQPEWIVFTGFAVILLACTSLLRDWKQTRFWVGTLIVSLLLALGSTTFVYPGLVRVIPGLNLLRVPSRLIFIVQLAVSMLAGAGLDLLVRFRMEASFQRRFRLLTVAGGCLVIALGVGFGLLDPGVELWQFLNLLFPVCILIWALVSTADLLTDRTMLAGWILILILQTTWVNGHLIERRNLPIQLAEQPELTAVMAESGGTPRIFSPSYSVPQHVAARFGLQLADGVNPLQLRSYYEYMAAATGFDPQDYSVTLPPFPSGDPSEPWGFDPDIERLQRLHIQWIVSDYPLESTDISQVATDDGLFIYSVDTESSRSWIERGDNTLGPATTLFHSPNRIIVTVTGPGHLVLSEVDYPGWNVELDGSEMEITLTDGIFRTVEIPEGEHEVEFSFQPLSVWFGAVVSAIGLVGLAVIWRKR